MPTRPAIGAVGDELDLRIKQGSTFGPHRLTFKHRDGTPLDLTGWTLRAQMRRHALDTEVLATFVCVVDAPVITDSRVESQAYFKLDAVTTASLPATEDPNDAGSLAVWDMEMAEEGSGHVTPVFRGNVQIVREVTRG